MVGLDGGVTRTVSSGSCDKTVSQCLDSSAQMLL